ncbi:CLUMA_CG006592, isoform A [Clunio marinus]|uniref:Fatty acyl-CoA reductase n=1 Tax=Clunio marinus TaxID=568069 RepID=A0A1J1I008_9DIPT|nr:CLUMA_CG006592, isoform A [Clunio marinus]
MKGLNSVQQFYKDKVVFITGGSGFMGKVLLEKLLYSCSSLKNIIILMRSKQEKSEMQRFREFKQLPMFQRIMNEKPHVMKKIIVVYGDVTLPKLGLSKEHLDKVLESNLVFHVAASLKLEATLKPNILMNLTGTKNVIDIAKMMPNHILMIHFSTAFCCVEQEILEEKIIEWKDNPEDLIRCAEWMSEEAMADMQKSVMGGHPNTYTYTKRLAEILVRNEYSKGFPICIIRPSVVVPAYKEPLPGWVDSLNGPAGLMLGAAKGVIRSMLVDGNSKSEGIPVDIAINGAILIAKKVANTSQRSQDVEVFNVTASETKKRTMKYILEKAKKINFEIPVGIGIWYPDGIITTNKFVHKINVLFLHWFPAYFIDLILFCLRQKRFMIRMQTKIMQGLEVLQFFTMRNWTFSSNNFKKLNDNLSSEEYQMFFIDTEAIPDSFEDEFIKNCLLGGRQYILKEKLSTIPRARMQIKMCDTNILCLQRKMTNMNSIQKFYKDKTIFITGASGFMGKVLLEKLLYSCSELKAVIILMRPKRGKSEVERVAGFQNIQMFQRIMNEKPHVMKKIIVVYGDVTLPKLGLSKEHLDKVLESNLVFHVAASLKLEATLKPNILMNLTGTKNVIDITKMMPNHILMVHFSTAFCCVEQEILEEKIIEWKDNPEDLIRCAEWMSEEAMAGMQKSVMGGHPNTYTYTKRLAEILVRNEYSKGFPICIIRPSVVVPAYKEPLPGWVDSLNGPAGLMLGAAKGVIRSMLVDGDLDAEIVPVDIAINGTIIIAKQIAMQQKRSNDVEVFNVTASETKKRTMKYILEKAKKINFETPLEMGLWYPDGTITTNKYVQKVNVALFHWLPAYFIDFLMFCLMQKRFMLHVQNRISQGLEVLQFFTMRQWVFLSQKFKDLNKNLSPEEYEMFFIDTDVVPDEFEDEFLRNCLLGARQFILKEPLSTIPRARIQMKIAYVVDRLCKCLFFYFIIKYLLNSLGMMAFIENLTMKSNQTSAI